MTYDDHSIPSIQSVPHLNTIHRTQEASRRISISQDELIGTKGRFHEKKLLVFWILSKRGGGALPNFFVTFLSVHFWSIKLVPFLQNDNNLNFKLFF